MTVEEKLFAAAMDRPTTAERQAYLDEACGGDVRLRSRMEQLLAAHQQTCGILEQGPHDACLPEPTLQSEQLFAGRFTLRQKLGEGGMGEVWVADQIEPVRRGVAVKVIRTGFATPRVHSRFDQERQALALMNHPNIAKVLDAGVVGGRPFFAMELIDGPPITRFCDEARLALRERVELLVSVCQAVQHAHQKGLIHRDLKPSNILVARLDGRPIPKVIDFGVAKVTGPRLGEPNISTEVGVLIGTLEYMSPEQADLNSLGLDTRSDVYSLGVLLYELLTGGVPFPRQYLQARPFAEMLRIIKEVEPPRPSARLAGSSTLPGVAADRRTESKRLVAQVRGELDWIVMKCLEKDPAHRYPTANELAADLERYLADEPIQASPPSPSYRLRKFAWRNRLPILAAGLVVLALVVGLVGTAVGFVRAERARRAEVESADRERRSKEVAEKRLAQFETGVSALGAIFDHLDPRAERKEGRPLRAILGDRLDRVTAELDGDAVGDPVIVAQLQDRLGGAYLGLGHPAKAAALFARAAETRRSVLGADHRDTLVSRHNQARAFQALGKRAEAVGLFEQVRERQTATLGADHRDTLTTENHLALAYLADGQPARAVTDLERVRDLQAKNFPADHPDVLTTLNNLALAYQADRKLTQAIRLFERVHDAQRKKLGATHPHALTTLNNLGMAHVADGQPARALPLFRQAAEGVEKGKFEHEFAGWIVGNLCRCHEQLGQLVEAEAWRRKWVAVARERDGEGTLAVGAELAGLGLNLLRQEKWTAAESVLRQALAAVDMKPETWLKANLRSMLGEALLCQARYKEAEPLLVGGYEALRDQSRKWKAVRPNSQANQRLREAMERLVRLYEHWDNPAAATRWREVLESIKEPGRR